MTPFSITCTTCRARLKISDPAAVGQILACPKCQSMVLVEAPAGWDISEMAGAGQPANAGQAAGAAQTAGRESQVVSIPPLTAAGEAKVANSPGSSGAWKGPIPPLSAAETEVDALLAPGTAGAKRKAAAAPLVAKLAQLDKAPQQTKTAPPAPSKPSAANQTSADVATPSKAPPKPSNGAPVARKSNVPVASPAWKDPPSPGTASASPVPNVAADTGSPWFWPALGGATFVSLLAAALIVYLSWRRGGAQPVVADANQPGAVKNAQPVTPTSTVGQPSGAANSNAGGADGEHRVAKPVAPEAGHARAGSATNQPTTQPQKSPAPVAVNMLPVQPQPVKSADGGDAANAGNNAAAPVAPVDAAAAAGPAPAVPAQPVKPIRPSLQRIAPKVVDVPGRLRDPLAGLTLRNTPLWQALAQLGDLSTIPITLDLDALAQRGLSASDPMNLTVKQTTIGGVLETMLAGSKLAPRVVENQLLITGADSRELRRVRYLAADLASSDAEGHSLARLIRDLVQPGTWKEKGGPASLAWSDGAVVVEQVDSAHAQILELCEKLRVARHLPLRSKFDPAQFQMGSRAEAAAQTLAQPITAGFAKPEALSRIVAHLRRAGHATILIDGVALGKEQLSVDTDALLVADHQALGQALTALVEPLDLAWRVAPNGVIEITTQSEAIKRTELAFYPTQSHAAVETLADQIARRLELTPTEASATIIRSDTSSGYLIVSAPQSVQLRVPPLVDSKLAQR